MGDFKRDFSAGVDPMPDDPLRRRGSRSPVTRPVRWTPGGWRETIQLREASPFDRHPVSEGYPMGRAESRALAAAVDRIGRG